MHYYVYYAHPYLLRFELSVFFKPKLFFHVNAFRDKVVTLNTSFSKCCGKNVKNTVSGRIFWSLKKLSIM